MAWSKVWGGEDKEMHPYRALGEQCVSVLREIDLHRSSSEVLKGGSGSDESDNGDEVALVLYVDCCFSPSPSPSPRIIGHSRRGGRSVWVGRGEGKRTGAIQGTSEVSGSGSGSLAANGEQGISRPRCLLVDGSTPGGFGYCWVPMYCT